MVFPIEVLNSFKQFDQQKHTGQRYIKSKKIKHTPTWKTFLSDIKLEDGKKLFYLWKLKIFINFSDEKKRSMSWGSKLEVDDDDDDDGNDDDHDIHFFWMFIQQKVVSIISGSRDHCNRSSPSRISDTLLARSEFRLSWMKFCSSDNHYTTPQLCFVGGY